MWTYKQPVTIKFGKGLLNSLEDILEEMKLDHGILISQDIFIENGLVDRILKLANGRIKTIFTNVDNNPTVKNIDDCAEIIRNNNNKFVIALGGGSVLDCSKAAATIATINDTIVNYHGTGTPLPETKIPLIAIPTTAGTGSEVTCIAVVTNHDLNKKAPINSDIFHVNLALIDSELTHSMPNFVTASTGIDVLCHALEGFWAKDHQPICDALALHACHNVFKYLRTAYIDPTNSEARDKMAEASVIAGLAFTIPKTTGSHAISFPLTNLYNIPHGTACGLTIDYLTRLNAEAEGGRLHKFAKKLGFVDAYDMADAIRELKESLNLRCDLKDLNLSEAQIEELVEKSEHPNLYNNPVDLNPDVLRKMFRSMT